ncbi:MAG: hypothetical protein K1Y02_01920 [Candidatus Hydrogenedentes bacterium]|nr:hypothetical protein [Candidatus Hydrogenedentota bacterium]
MRVWGWLAIVMTSCVFASMPAIAQESANRGSVMRKSIEPKDVTPELDVPSPKQEKIKPPKKQEQRGPLTAWPAGLNDYFGVEFEIPTTEQVLSSIAAHLNRRTLAGVKPEEEYRTFAKVEENVQRMLPKNDLELTQVSGFYRNLTEWVRLEVEYTQKPSRGVLKDLREVVDSQAKLDPDFDPERRDKIIGTIESQGLFVPAGILFGVSVLPWRPMPAGLNLFEVTATPAFSDKENRAEAIFDFLQCPGPVYRIDFDTLSTTALRVDMSEKEGQFDLVEEWKSNSQQGVRGPAILRKPFRSRFMRVTAESPNEAAVLRNVRVFATKEPAAAVCKYTKVAPKLDGDFKESMWPAQPQIDGFVNPETLSFAEAQTTVRVCNTADTLYIGVYAREPRVATMVAVMTDDEAPVWDEESVELAIRPSGKPEYKFFVNPKGARFDSRDNDANWNGEWQVVTKLYQTGWVAEIAIPFSTLGVKSSGATDWTLDCVRNRRNVVNERSVWAFTSPEKRSEHGSLIFSR